MKLTKEMVDYLYAAQHMNADQEERFLEKLRESFSEDETRHIAILIGYFRVQLHPDMKRVIVRDMGESMYRDFNS